MSALKAEVLGEVGLLKDPDAPPVGVAGETGVSKDRESTVLFTGFKSIFEFRQATLEDLGEFEGKFAELFGGTGSGLVPEERPEMFQVVEEIPLTCTRT